MKAIAQGGGIIVLPKRVVIEGNKKTVKLNIANISKDTVKYVASIIDMTMQEDGTYKRSNNKDTSQKTASSHLRIYPKSIYLGPNETQTVSVQLLNASKMAPGEYRSHVLFDVEPDSTQIRPLPKKLVNNIKLKLIPVFYLTIPVIVRIGENTTKVTFTSAALEYAVDSTPQINFTLTREGNMSAYGDINVSHVYQKKTTNVARVKGIAIYESNNASTTRKMTIPLDNAAKLNYSTGSIRITYTTQDDKPKPIADTTITLEQKK